MNEEGVEFVERGGGALQKGDADASNARNALRRRRRHLLNEAHVGGGAPRNGNAGKARSAPFLSSSIFISFFKFWTRQKKLSSYLAIGSVLFHLRS